MVYTITEIALIPQPFGAEEQLGRDFFRAVPDRGCPEWQGDSPQELCLELAARLRVAARVRRRW